MAEITVATTSISQKILNLKHTFPNLEVLYCFKSLPVPEVLDSIGHVFDGIEVSNINEINQANKHKNNTLLKKPIYLTATNDLEFLETKHNISVLPTLNSLKYCKHPFFVRINPPEFLDHQIVKDLDVSTSRFGVTPYELKRLQSHHLYHGVHLHLGRTMFNTKETFENLFRALRYFNIPALNLGGSFHNMDKYLEIIDLAFFYFKDARILCEPGRWMSQNAVTGFAHSIQQNTVRDLHNIKISLSKEIHCKWSDELTVSIPKVTNNSILRRVHISGPTCFELDKFGVFNLEVPLERQTEIKFQITGLTGYCIAFNSAFNGVSPAEVKII
jgi:diaminopimelate decarboxylase